MLNKQIEAQVLALRDELVRFANRLDRNNGEDIVQEAIIRVLKVDREFNENDNLRAYCYTIVRNLALNGFTRKAEKTVQMIGKDERGRVMDNDECVVEVLDAHPSPSAEAQALRGEFSFEMTNALNSLNEGIRETFLLVTVEGLSYDECAQVQGIAINTVSSRVSRAKSQLKKQLVSA